MRHDSRGELTGGSEFLRHPLVSNRALRGRLPNESGVPDDLADLDAVDGDRVASRRVRPDLLRRCPRGLLGFEDDHPSTGAVVEADPVPRDEAWRLLECRNALLVQELPTSP